MDQKSFHSHFSRKCNGNKFLKAGQFVSAELCVAPATQEFMINPVCNTVLQLHFFATCDSF